MVGCVCSAGGAELTMPEHPRGPRSCFSGGGAGLVATASPTPATRTAHGLATENVASKTPTAG